MDAAAERVTGMLSLRSTLAPAVLEVEEHASQAAFVALEHEWNALADAVGAGFFARHECIRAWMSSFAAGLRLVVLTARDGGGRLVGALPLLSEMAFVCGLPARHVAATANTHSCRFDLLAADPQAAGRAFLAHLVARPGWEVLRLSDVPEGGDAWHLYAAARELGLPVGEWESQRSPYLSFPSTYDALMASKSPTFRANLRRRRRQLERLGRLEVERVSSETQVEQRLDEGFALERAGWKGREGTAIAQDRPTRAFYTELACRAARQGHLALFFLRLDGRAVAFHYGLVHGGVYYVPKLAYDETLKGCSPGLVLVDAAIQDGIARGLRGYDFLGAEAEWKNKWSTSVRPHHWLFVFRDSSVGHALRKAKFEWVPAAKRALMGLPRTGGAS